MNKMIGREIKVVKKSLAQMKSQVGKMKAPNMPRMSKEEMMVAGVVAAGVTLLGSIAGFSLYLVKHGQKKVDFKKMKINTERAIKSAQKKITPVVKKTVKVVAKKAKQVKRKMA